MTDRAGVDTGGFGGGSRSGGALKVLAWIGGIGCLLAILLVATCVGGAGYLFQTARSGTADVVEPFFEDLHAGRWDRAYERLGPGWRGRMDPDAFRAEFEPLIERVGALSDLDIRSLQAEVDEGTKDIRYRATFERGVATVAVRLVTGDDGVARIEGLRMNLPAEPPATDDAMELPGVTVIEGEDGGAADEDRP